MHLKTFHAPSIQDAIRQARQELGSDAMLLNSRRITPSGEASSVFAVTFATAAPPAPAQARKSGAKEEPFARAGSESVSLREEQSLHHAETAKNPAPSSSPSRHAMLDSRAGSSRTGADSVLGAPPLPSYPTGAFAGDAADSDAADSDAADSDAADSDAADSDAADSDAADSDAGKRGEPVARRLAETRASEASQPGQNDPSNNPKSPGAEARTSNPASNRDEGRPMPAAAWAGAPLPSYEKLFEQMTSMRREMLQLAGSVRRASAAGYRQDLPNEDLRWAYDVLVSQEFYPEVIEDVIDQITPQLTPSSPPEPAARIRKRRRARGEEHIHGSGLLPLLRDALASRIELAPEPSFRRRNSSPHLVAVVGPPGVGKTTTLVKLAARYGITSRFPLQIISMDNYRVAASEQLRTYASVLGVGFDALPSAASLEKALRQYESKDLILIDTPGYGWRDFPAAEDLAAVLRQAESATIHLVVSASMKPGDLARVADLYEVFGYRAILFTKTDETATIGPLVSESAMRRKPLSYLCAGQRIPEDLEVASRERILERLLPASLSSDECAA